MRELLALLQQIGNDFKGEEIWFPQFIMGDAAKEIDLQGYDKQKSDISLIEYEYVSQSGGGITGDDFYGVILYPYKNIWIKVHFHC